MPVYSSGSRRPGRPSRAFRLAYFDAGPEAGIQAVYVGAARGTRQHGKRNRGGDRECGQDGRGGFVVTCCFGSQTQAGTNHPTLVREPVHHLRAPVNANRRT